MPRLVYGVLRTHPASLPCPSPPETCARRPRNSSARHCRSPRRHPMPIMRRCFFPSLSPLVLISLLNRVSVASRSASALLDRGELAMSVSCGSLRAAPSPLLTAHSLADGPCHTYYSTIYSHRTDGEKEEHITSCHIVLSLHHLHTRPVLSHFPSPCAQPLITNWVSPINSSGCLVRRRL